MSAVNEVFCLVICSAMLRVMKGNESKPSPFFIFNRVFQRGDKFLAEYTVVSIKILCKHIKHKSFLRVHFELKKIISWYLLRSFYVTSATPSIVRSQSFNTELFCRL